MEGHVLHHQGLIQNEFPVNSESECLEQYSGQAGPSSYSQDSSIDQFRRDGTLPQPAASDFPYATSHPVPSTRLYSESGVASDATTSYQSANIFTDTSSGSISSPASAGSAVPQSSYYASDTTTPRYTTYSSLPGSVSVTHPQAFAQSTYARPQFPTIYESVPSNNPLQPLRHTIGESSNAVYRASYTATPQYVHRQPLVNSYYAQTPRTVNSTGLTAFSPSQPSYMGDSSHGGMARTPNECSSDFKFPDLSCALDMRCNEQTLTPEIHAKVEKGFFLSETDQKWTCYRRNYFSVHVSFTLHCNTNNAPLFVKHRGKEEQVSAMGMRLSAAIDGSSGKKIELIQHTPKRDNGPKSKIDIVRVSPQPPRGRTDTVSPNHIYQVPMSTFHATGAVLGPFLPLQNVNDPNDDSSESQQSGHQQNHSSVPLQYPGAANTHMSVPGQSTHHTFERIQFKQATANNGKRRASQQYFHLVVELFADTRKDVSEDNKWIRIAHRTSENIVVRGRSPSHYQNESHGHGNRGGSADGGGYGNGIGAPGYASINGVGYHGSGGGYGGSLSSSSGHRGPNYGYNAADGRGSSSPESEYEQAGDAGLQPNPLIPEADRSGFSSRPGYSYHPSTLYEQVPTQFRLPKFEGTGHSSTDPRQYAFKTEIPEAVPDAQWQANGCDRYQGFSSSQGWYPHLPTNGSGCS